MSDNGFSLIDLKGVSEPLTKLIDTVGNAIGAIYEPTRIRRKARAEADAMLIKTEAEGIKKDIEHRTFERLRNREIRSQQNIENIVRMSSEALPDSVSDEPVNEDWVYQFFDHCKDISDEEMQSMWGRILAGEIAKPKSFSLQTLRLVKDLSKEDAHIFTSICSFVWQINKCKAAPFIESEAVPFIFHHDKFFSHIDQFFNYLLHLESIGFISTNFLTGYVKKNLTEFSFSYFDKKYIIKKLPNQTPSDFPFGSVLFTNIGRELFPISCPLAVKDYEEWAIKKIESMKFTVEEVEEN